MVLEVTLDCCLFGKIMKIIIGASKIPFLIYEPLITIGNIANKLFDQRFIVKLTTN